MDLSFSSQLFRQAVYDLLYKTPRSSGKINVCSASLTLPFNSPSLVLKGSLALEGLSTVRPRLIKSVKGGRQQKRSLRGYVTPTSAKFFFFFDIFLDIVFKLYKSDLFFRAFVTPSGVLFTFKELSLLDNLKYDYFNWPTSLIVQFPSGFSPLLFSIYRVYFSSLR